MRHERHFIYAWAAIVLLAPPVFAQQGPWNGYSGYGRMPAPYPQSQMAGYGRPTMAAWSSDDVNDRASSGYADASDNSSQAATSASNTAGQTCTNCNNGACDGAYCGDQCGGQCGAQCGYGPCGILGHLCCCGDCCGCCASPWEHRTSVFVDYLYLRPFGVDMAHGIQQNGVGGQGTVPAGIVGVAAPDFDSSFRIGFHRACDACEGITVTYTQFESETSDRIRAAPGIGGTAASLVLHPGTVTSASTFDFLSANYGIDFRTADFDYNFIVNDWDCGAVNFTLGARYGHLQQSFAQFGQFAGATGEEFVNTNTSFDGGGLRAGFDGVWAIGHTRFGLYGKGFVDVLFGTFDSQYRQFNVTTETVEAYSRWRDQRVVPILEYELGLQWTNCCGNWRLALGYYNAFWFNTVDTAEWIQAVQTSDFTRANQTISFSGLTSRLEFRF